MHEHVFVVKPSRATASHRTVLENVLTRFGLDSATSRTATVTGRRGRLRRRVNRAGRNGERLPAGAPGLVAVRCAIAAAAAMPPRWPGSRQATTSAPSSAAASNRITRRASIVHAGATAPITRLAGYHGGAGVAQPAAVSAIARLHGRRRGARRPVDVVQRGLEARVARGCRRRSRRCSPRRCAGRTPPPARARRRRLPATPRR